MALQEIQFRAYLINSFHLLKCKCILAADIHCIWHLTNIPGRDQVLNRLTDINDRITSGDDLSLELICPHVLISADLSFYEDRSGWCDVELNTAVNPFHGVFFGKLGMIKHLRWTLVCSALYATKKNKEMNVFLTKDYLLLCFRASIPFYANTVLSQFLVPGDLIFYETHPSFRTFYCEQRPQAQNSISSTLQFLHFF